MNRLTLFSFALPVLLATLLSVGCAVEQTSNDRTGSDDSAGAEIIGADDNGQEGSTSKYPANKKLNADGTEACSNCGPLPDPWKRGPLPDPWQSKPPGSIDPNAPNSSSSGGNHKD